MKASLVLFCGAVVTAGCAGPVTPVQVEGVQSTDEAGAVGCQYVDTVIGSSGWYGVNAGLGLSNARTDALNQAKAIGANRVVWVPMAQGYGSTHASARAYKCGG